VLWPAGDDPDDYGQPTRGTPIDLKVRWNLKRGEVAGPNGVPVSFDATAVVDRQIAAGSTMWLGTLEDWNATGSAGDESELMRVVLYDEIKDLKGRATRRVVTLKRFRDSLPDAAG
jgi:hypothetical protein